MGSKRKKREIPAEEAGLTDSFVRLVKRMGPKRAPSATLRKSMLFQLSKRESVENLCALVEYFMHIKRRDWSEDIERGRRWKEYVERWIDENRALISAVALARK